MPAMTAACGIDGSSSEWPQVSHFHYHRSIRVRSKGHTRLKKHVGTSLRRQFSFVSRVVFCQEFISQFRFIVARHNHYYGLS